MQPMYLGGAEIGRSSSWSCLVGDFFTDSIIVNHHETPLFWEYFVLDLFPIIKLPQFPKKMVFLDVGGPSTFLPRWEWTPRLKGSYQGKYGKVHPGR